MECLLDKNCRSRHLRRLGSLGSPRDIFGLGLYFELWLELLVLGELVGELLVNWLITLALRKP